MLMAVMRIRIMRMFMSGRLVTVLMDMWSFGLRIMLVLMVPIIMDMWVRVLYRLMFMFVFMMFGKMEPSPESH